MLIHIQSCRNGTKTDLIESIFKEMTSANKKSITRKDNGNSYMNNTRKLKILKMI